MNDSFLSVVQDRDNPLQLLVRSRVEGDIERAVCGLFPVEVSRDLKADYRYRSKMSRLEFEGLMVESVRRIDYPNFKASIRNRERHKVAFAVWTEVHVSQGSFGNQGILIVKHPQKPPTSDNLQTIKEEAMKFEDHTGLAGQSSRGVAEQDGLGWRGTLRQLRGLLFNMQRDLGGQDMLKQSPEQNSKFRRLYTLILARWAEAEE